MGTVGILHLSDLHFSNLNDEEFNEFLRNILNQVESYIFENKYIIDIIVITGDLIDRGKIDNWNNVYKFFIVPLSQKSNVPIKNIFCVPGNHDAERSERVKQVLLDNCWLKYDRDNSKITDIEYYKKARENKWRDIFKNKSSTEMAELFARYNKYNEFCEKLQKPLKSFGVDQVEIVRENDITNVRVVSINSSILSNGCDDYQCLAVSQYQLNQIVSKIKEKSAIWRKPDLTITLMHHPIDWLTGFEQQTLRKFLSDPHKIPTDLFFHGHTHEGAINNIMDLDTCMMNLVTGTSYNEFHQTNQIKGYNNCRMALYQVDTNQNILYGKLSILNNAPQQKFVPDLSSYSFLTNDGEFSIFYGKKLFESTKNILTFQLPIDARKTISNNSINNMDNLIESLWNDVYERSMMRLNELKNRYNSTNEIQFSEKVRLTRDWLTAVAMEIKVKLFKEKFQNDIRVHFRKYNPSNGGFHEEFVSTFANKKLTSIQWAETNNLIYFSYRHQRSLVKSCNPDKFFETGTGIWKDFLTAPMYDYSHSELYPQLSFGISVKGDCSNQLTEILELLSFLRIELFLKVLRKAFDEKFFKIKDLIKEINNIKDDKGEEIY